MFTKFLLPLYVSLKFVTFYRLKVEYSQPNLIFFETRKLWRLFHKRKNLKGSRSNHNQQRHCDAFCCIGYRCIGN